ncbi:YeiH family protein [Thalassobacillus sp. CUG 92003]|uniref:YeiH family protein n=1 Tax=Thalassobacillus sp. CUG 92003 TaxID=2736641 RepID=UPI0015E79AD2|nr:putative sulfate exporter family transporter [Thalassobacillus sp. CUG 92003]
MTQPITSNRFFFYGIGLTSLFAAAGFLLAYVPYLATIGPLAIAILLAVGYRQFKGYPTQLNAGIIFSSKKLLRLAIILFGLKLNINVIFAEGLPLIGRDAAVVVFAIGLTMLFAKWFKADRSLSLLLGIGTGVCGASAIAAVSPILKAKEEDTAISAGIISIIGTLFAVSYTVIRPFLPIEMEAYGMWAGLSLHEVAHVALAGAPAGESGLAMALLAKLGRVFLLVPLTFFLIWLMQRKNAGHQEAKPAFPWFLLGFIGMSLFGSYILGIYVPAPQAVMDAVSFVTTFILTMAMVGLGLSVSLTDLKARAIKPLLAMALASVVLSVATYFIL